MYGPPGTGKSYLAKAVATEADSHFLAVSSSDLVSKWQGESEKLVRALFSLARAKKPSIIFIDECDSLCGSRSGDQSDSSRRVLNEFLVQMQGVGKDNQGVLVLGATNTPWSIDAAMRRRFQKRIYIPLPDADARRVMFKIHIGKTLHTLGDSDFDAMGVMSEGMSGSDISHVVNEALYEPVRRIRGATHFRRDPATGKYEPCDPRAPGAEAKTIADLSGDDLGVPKVTPADFVRVMKRAKATVGADELKQFDDWTKEFGEEGN